jgi:predicted ATPase
MNKFYITVGTEANFSNDVFVKSLRKNIMLFDASEAASGLHRELATEKIFNAYDQQLGMVMYPESGFSEHRQLKLAHYLCWLCANRCSVELFTNSEIFLLALRVAVRTEKIKPEQVVISYFNIHSEKIELIEIDKQGKLSNWPRGFFDTTNSLLEELI